jgi:hypothetical protein
MYWSDFLEALCRAGSRWQVGCDGSDWQNGRLGCYVKYVDLIEPTQDITHWRTFVNTSKGLNEV